MDRQPTLSTARRLLRPFRTSDAADVQRLAGDERVACTTLNIPHPYEDGVAEAWIGTHDERFGRGEEVVFAIERRSDGLLIGAIGLVIDQRQRSAELGYWLGVLYWGQGYCTEAARAAMTYAFVTCDLERVHACHLARNPASGRVMRKLGMAFEGCRRGHVLKWGCREDLVLYGLLRKESNANG